MSVVEFKLKPKTVNCEACGCLMQTTEPAPYCCDACLDESFDAHIEELEVISRAAGFACLDAQIEYEMNRSAP